MSNCSATDKSDTMQIIKLTMPHFVPIFLCRSLKSDAHQLFLCPTARPQGHRRVEVWKGPLFSLPTQAETPTAMCPGPQTNCFWVLLLHHLPEHSVPVHGHSHTEKVFPDVQRELPMFLSVPLVSSPGWGTAQQHLPKKTVCPLVSHCLAETKNVIHRDRGHHFLISPALVKWESVQVMLGSRHMKHLEKKKLPNSIINKFK